MILRYQRSLVKQASLPSGRREETGYEVASEDEDMIAALYVERGGAYYDLPEIDPWDEARDARRYEGPHPVIAHPPCSTWCRLAAVNEARWGHPIGSDGGCFEAALSSVRRWGGVLEHPAYTYAWGAFGLPRPVRDGWQQLLGERAWVTEVSQSAYGHDARKRTWLLYVGERPPELLDWNDPEGTAWVGNDGSPGAKRQLSKAEAKRTPPPFRDLLIRLARGARPR